MRVQRRPNIGARAAASPFAAALVVLATCTLAAGAGASELAPPDGSEASRQDRRILRSWSVFWSFLIWPAGSTVSVCFFDRDAELREMFAATAGEWTRIANIRFDFGAPPGYRTCDSTEPSDIRVQFRSASALSIAAGSSSVGTLSLDLPPGKPTLFIGLQPLPGKPRKAHAEMRPTILHEVGHALGLPHEHQHPQSPCFSEYRWKELCAARQARVAEDLTLMEAHRYARQLQAQMMPRVDPVDAGLFPYDVHSIMHYRFPARFLSGGQHSACHSRGPRTLSAGDAARMAVLYPRSAEAQADFLREKAQLFRRTLARSGLSRRTAERLALYAEDRLERRHAALGIKISLEGLDLPERDTAALESRLARGTAPGLPAECAARQRVPEKDAVE